MSGDVISLLQSKNRCLERLLNLSEQFLSTCSGDSAGTDDASFSENILKAYQTERDTVFKALSLYDRKISEVIAALPSEERTTALIIAVEAELIQKDRLIQLLISADNRIMAKIEEEKNRILEALSSARKNQALMSKFKSAWVPESGEELDKTL